MTEYPAGARGWVFGSAAETTCQRKRWKFTMGAGRRIRRLCLVCDVRRQKHVALADFVPFLVKLVCRLTWLMSCGWAAIVQLVSENVLETAA